MTTANRCQCQCECKRTLSFSRWFRKSGPLKPFNEYCIRCGDAWVLYDPDHGPRRENEDD